MVRLIKESALSRPEIADMLVVAGFENEEEGYLDYFLEYNPKYVASVNLDDMGAYIDNLDTSEHIPLPFANGADRMILRTKEDVRAFLDYIYELDYDDIFESVKTNSRSETSPKQQFNKIISKLRKYAKEHDCYMTIEKFSMGDNSGSIYLYITTNRTTMSGSVKFTFDLGYGKSQKTDWKTYFVVSCLDESDAPSFDEEVFYSYEEAYEFILNYIIEYGNIDS